MPVSGFDIETRVESAALELLAAFADLTALAPKKIVSRRNTASAADYPAVWVQAVGFAEFGRHLGWYRGGLQIAGVTHRADDKSLSAVKTLLGALRYWTQQTDLVTQLNATAAAKAAATALDVRDVELDGAAFDYSDEQTNELIIVLAVLCRPSRAITT